MSDEVSIPTEAVAAMARQQALLDSDPVVIAPEGVDVDVWDVLKEATVDSAEHADGDLHVWLEGEVQAQKCVARATRMQPAEYRTDDLTALVSIMWDMNPEHSPSVDIEVVER